MLLRHKYYSKQSKIPWYRPFFWTLYCTAIVFVFKEFQVDIGIPLAIPSILGTAISLFLGFRTNSAYQRWWEARKVWGEIVNNSRTLARQVLNFGIGNSDSRTNIIHRQIAWNWSLAYRLRGLGWSNEADTYLSEQEIKRLKKSEHVPNLLLLEQERELTNLVKNGELDSFDLRKIDSTLKELCDSMGKCERIKGTVFPTQYSLFTLVFINTFLTLLPLGMVSSLGYFSVPIHITIGFTFGMIQNIAESMQAPFENRPNDIPIFSISRIIERNLLEMTEAKVLPKVYASKDGVLM